MDLDEPQIEYLEQESGAFDIRVNGVAIWERIPTSVYRVVLCASLRGVPGPV